MADDFKPCSVAGCNGNAHGKARGCRGYCSKHYQRLSNHGDPNAGGVFRVTRGEPMRWLQAHLDHGSDDCLPWPYLTLKGYGRVNGKYAHRVMCELKHGAPPTPRHQAAHICGMGHEGCVNPRHVRWATASENAADKIEHGTMPKGEDHFFAKLTEGDVREIRAVRKMGGASLSQLASCYNVSVGTIQALLDGKTWAWLK